MPNWSPTPAVLAPHPAAARPDPILEKLLRRWLAVGLLAVVLVPALRGSGEWLGWWPMWLVGMPAMAWWALHRFRLPRSGRTATIGGRRRRIGRQARRRTLPASSARHQAA